MINRLSLRIANKLTEYDNMPQQDVMKYSLRLIITNVLTMVLIVTIGIITRNLSNTLIAAISFSILRSFSGGYHIKNPEICIVTSVMMVWLVSTYSYLFERGIIIIGVFSLIVMIIYSPYGIKRHSLLDEKYHYLFKIVSVLISVIGLFFNNIIISVSFLLQAITILFMRGGEFFEKTNE